MKFVFKALILSFLVLRCTHVPTTISESDVSLLQRAHQFEQSHRPIQITAETVVLDVRAFFDYQLLRVPGSLYIDSRDFSLRRVRGDDLQKKAVKLARRLALMGINPFSHVVVVGYGDKGQGEEGEVALTLLTLGIEQVQVASFDSFKKMATTKEAPQRPNQRYWEPRVIGSIMCPAYNSTTGAFIIDVSGQKNPAPQTPVAQMATFTKSWKDFVNKNDFSPNRKIKDQLNQEKITQDSRIMVRGPQAPLVTFSLLQSGYTAACLLDE